MPIGIRHFRCSVVPATFEGTAEGESKVLKQLAAVALLLTACSVCVCVLNMFLRATVCMAKLVCLANIKEKAGCFQIILLSLFIRQFGLPLPGDNRQVWD
jgi:hypothetical protein